MTGLLGRERFTSRQNGMDGLTQKGMDLETTVIKNKIISISIFFQLYAQRNIDSCRDSEALHQFHSNKVKRQVTGFTIGYKIVKVPMEVSTSLTYLQSGFLALLVHI